MPVKKLLSVRGGGGGGGQSIIFQTDMASTEEISVFYQNMIITLIINPKNGKFETVPKMTSSVHATPTNNISPKMTRAILLKF